MATPHPAARKLRELMGEEAGGSMVEWLDNLDEHYDGLRQEMRADIAELRHEMHARFDGEFSTIRLEIVGLREEVRVGFATLRQEMATQMATLLKWVVGLWITSLAATVGLTTLMRGLR